MVFIGHVETETAASPEDNRFSRLSPDLEELLEEHPAEPPPGDSLAKIRAIRSTLTTTKPWGEAEDSSELPLASAANSGVARSSDGADSNAPIAERLPFRHEHGAMHPAHAKPDLNPKPNSHATGAIGGLRSDPGSVDRYDKRPGADNGTGRGRPPLVKQ